MSEKRGIDMKSNFYILFKSYRDKQLIKQQQLAKQMENCEAGEHKEVGEFEQKPLLKFNDFYDEEENEIKDMRREKNKKRKAQIFDEERLAKIKKKLETIKKMRR